MHACTHTHTYTHMRAHTHAHAHISLNSLKSSPAVPNTVLDDILEDNYDVYTPEEPHVTPEMEQTSFSTLSGINTLLGISPVKFLVK